MKKIYISPSDQTANRYTGVDTNEAAVCRKIGSALQRALERCGMASRMDSEESMEARAAESDSWGADLHLCIHTNACRGNTAGTRLFSYDEQGTGYRACQAVLGRLGPLTPGDSDSIVPWPGLYEIRSTRAPAVYLEVGFHDHPREAVWMASHTEEIAEAICQGLCDFYVLPYVAPGGYCNTLDQVPDYARATVEKLLNRDILVGTPKGLELSRDMLRVLVLLDRAGVFAQREGEPG